MARSGVVDFSPDVWRQMGPLRADFSIRTAGGRPSGPFGAVLGPMEAVFAPELVSRLVLQQTFRKKVDAHGNRSCFSSGVAGRREPGGCP